MGGCDEQGRSSKGKQAPMAPYACARVGHHWSGLPLSVACHLGFPSFTDLHQFSGCRLPGALGFSGGCEYGRMRKRAATHCIPVTIRYRPVTGAFLRDHLVHVLFVLGNRQTGCVPSEDAVAPRARVSGLPVGIAQNPPGLGCPVLGLASQPSSGRGRPGPTSTEGRFSSGRDPCASERPSQSP